MQAILRGAHIDRVPPVFVMFQHFELRKRLRRRLDLSREEVGRLPMDVVKDFDTIATTIHEYQLYQVQKERDRIEALRPKG